MIHGALLVFCFHDKDQGRAWIYRMMVNASAWTCARHWQSISRLERRIKKKHWKRVGVFRFLEAFYIHTVDGSEIRRSPPKGCK